MALANIQAVLPYELQKVWDTVTSLEACGWRSDLSRIEVLSPERFVEYTRKGYATTFTTTVWEPGRRWEFDMENDRISGHWTGIFTEENGRTRIDFTEEVVAKKFFLKPFVKAYLKKQQAAYLADLKKALATR